jgi:hypothetical protein
MNHSIRQLGDGDSSFSPDSSLVVTETLGPHETPQRTAIAHPNPRARASRRQSATFLSEGIYPQTRVLEGL